MSTEENKALARRLIEKGINQRNWAVLDELCAPDFVLHNSALTLQGLEPMPDQLLCKEEFPKEGVFSSTSVHNIRYGIKVRA